jgi:hypothetical protein
MLIDTDSAAPLPLHMKQRQISSVYLRHLRRGLRGVRNLWEKKGKLGIYEHTVIFSITVRDTTKLGAKQASEAGTINRSRDYISK